MRVLIYNPPGPEGRGYIREGRCEQRLSSYAYRMLPVSLPSIAGLLRAEGHQVRILDAVGPRVTVASLPREVRKFDPELVVVAVSTPTYPSDVRAVAELATWTKAHLTAIGVHVTATPEETLRGSRLHSVVRGEPEWTVADLVARLSDGGDLSSIPGLTFRNGDAIVHNADRAFEPDLDALPPPARDLLPEEDYFLPIFNRPYTLVVPTRGCPHHCTYCTAPLYYGKKLRRRTPEKVVDEIESILRRGTVRDIVMWSDTFTLDRAFVVDVCREIVRRKLDFNWMSNSRVDSIDADLAAIMRDAGCNGIAFGIESGVQEILDRVRKGTTVEQGRVAIANVKAAGISTLGHFILGLPGETPETIRRTIDYAKEIDPDWAQFYAATPLPGTTFREQAVKSGSLPIATSWDRHELNTPIISTPELSADELQRWRKRAYLEFYLRPRVARRVARRVEPRHIWTLARQAGTFVRSWVLDA
ncbi:Radical SAM domain protein [Minicystis rosea]|nr:Radical SAM domain protein [Minicystis rosea]